MIHGGGATRAWDEIIRQQLAAGARTRSYRVIVENVTCHHHRHIPADSSQFGRTGVRLERPVAVRSASLGGGRRHCLRFTVHASRSDGSDRPQLPL